MSGFTPEMRAKAAETKRNNAQIRRNSGATPVSTGVGESKRFGGDYRPADVVLKEEELLDCHLNGNLIRDMDIPPHVLANLSYQHTDEGVAERNAGRSEHHITTVRDEFTGACQRRADSIDRGMEPWEANNPMQDLMDKHVRPGFRGRFLNPATINQRGMRGWQPVLDQDGREVRVRDQILAEMPIDKAKQRNAHYLSQSKAAVREVQKTFTKQAPADGQGAHAVGSIEGGN